MGMVQLSNGRTVVQLNRFSDGKIYFRSVEESADHVFVKKFTPRKRGRQPRVIVACDGVEIELPRRGKAFDLKSQGELINMLDSHPRIATVGALLLLRNDEYTVLGVYPDKVTVRFHRTGEVFGIVGFAEGECDLLSGGSEE